MTARPQHIGDLFDPRLAVRRTDPETSLIASVANQSGRAIDRQRVLEAHYESRATGLTDFELARLVGRKQTSAGKRRGELRDYGLIQRTAEHRPSDTGSPAIVWKITQTGIEEVEKGS